MESIICFKDGFLSFWKIYCLLQRNPVICSQNIDGSNRTTNCLFISDPMQFKFCSILGVSSLVAKILGNSGLDWSLKRKKELRQPHTSMSRKMSYPRHYDLLCATNTIFKLFGSRWIDSVTSTVFYHINRRSTGKIIKLYGNCVGKLRKGRYKKVGK